MNKKEQERTRKNSLSFKKLKIFLIIIIFVSSLFLLYRIYSSPNRKAFSLRKGSDEKIVIYGLEKEEIRKIDWQKGATWTNHYSGMNNFQYLFQEKEANLFGWLVRKPKVYNVVSELKEHEIRNKEIEFEGHSGIKNVVIPNTEYILNEKSDMFFKEGLSIKDLFAFFYYLAIAILLLFLIDRVFGSNILGFLFYPFTAFRGSGGENIVSNIKFKDVGGLQEAKEELGEVLSYFRNPQVFGQRGATVPKGILLVGQPGNGKTLLAKALAGECGLPFLARSGSEFEEMMVGVGARRVRELFQQARSYPQGCIVFIDEIDSIGRKRYSVNTSHNEQTLNQLLHELDGFRPRDNIIILAATNSLKVLDSALLRPGRFDRQIHIPLPNLRGRQEIIKLYGKKIPLKPEIDLEEIISMTKGFSGAQIVNMLNESSILSIRYGKKFIDQEIIFEAYDRTLMGPSLTSQTITPKKRKIVAYHEAGHAIIGLSLPETIVKKITIIPRLSAGGYTWISLRGEEGDDYLLNKSQMLANIMTCLGGRTSEELVFGSSYVTVGAYEDFKTASKIIQDYILNYGMSDLGIISTQKSFFYDEETTTELSEITKQKIENEREKILSQCWKKVRDIIRQKRKVLCLLAEVLLEKNSLHKDEINYIFINQVSPYISLIS